MRLSGKVCIITGAGNGMGKAAAHLFAREGASVAVVDLSPRDGEQVARAVRDEGGDAAFFACDITDPESVQAMAGGVLEVFGRIDVLYNNAGSSHGVFGPLHTLDVDGFDRVIRTNIRGTFLCSKYVIPHLLAAGGGSIINVASAVGLVGWKTGAALSTAKGGVVLMTKAMALDYADQGIRVNVLCPGSTMTAQTEARLAGARTEEERQAIIAPLIAHHAIPRLARPEEIAAAALFLASDESSFMTGAELAVDGGWTA